MPKRLPVAAGSESLGSGNTTLLERIRGKRERLRMQVGVDNMNEANGDAPPADNGDHNAGAPRRPPTSGRSGSAMPASATPWASAPGRY